MFKFLLTLLLITPLAMADVPNPDFTYSFDNLQGVPAARAWNLGTKITEAHRTAICVYDVATMGGSVSTMSTTATGNVPLLSTDLVTPCLLPGKSVIRNGFIDVTTAALSGGSTSFSLSSGKTKADLMLTTLNSSFGVGQYAVIPKHATVSSYIKLPTANSIVGGVNTNAYQPYVTLGGSTGLTAGHFRVFIDYAISE